MNPKNTLKNLEIDTMTCVSKKAFQNGFTCKILRLIANVMTVLLNTERLVKAAEKVNEHSMKTMERSTQNVQQYNEMFDGICWMQKCHFLRYKECFGAKVLLCAPPTPRMTQQPLEREREK